MRVEWSRLRDRDVATLRLSIDEQKLVREAAHRARFATDLLERERLNVPPELRDRLERIALDVTAFADPRGIVVEERMREEDSRP